MGAPNTDTSLVEDDGDDHESNCKTCRFFYGLDLPVTEPLSIEQLSALARDHSGHIFRCWVQLNTLLKRHEELVRKRWLKKTFAQRKIILSEAWPGIPATHRPDFEGIRYVYGKHLSTAVLTRPETWLQASQKTTRQGKDQICAPLAVHQSRRSCQA